MEDSYAEYEPIGNLNFEEKWYQKYSFPHCILFQS